MIVCICEGVSEHAVKQCLTNGAATVKDIARCTGAGTGCGTCRESLRDMVAQHAESVCQVKRSERKVPRQAA